MAAASATVAAPESTVTEDNKEGSAQDTQYEELWRKKTEHAVEEEFQKHLRVCIIYMCECIVEARLDNKDALC